MNSRKTSMGIAVLLLAGWGSARADSVTWTQGTTPIAKWGIDPANPGPADIISFTGPTKVYSNSCVAEGNLGGTPQLTIDPASKVVLLWFEGPAPQVCTLDYRPVCGLEGEFGPLPAGEWTFTTLSKEILFEIKFTVGGGQAAYYVDGDAPGPVHDGGSWATAFLTLQDALAAATNGDEILVAEGTYKPDQGGSALRGDREASFVLKEGLTVRGGYAGYGQPDPDERDVASHETILSGDLNGDDLWGILNTGDNSYHVVTGPAGELAARLDGFTVTHGRGDGTYPHHYGGGLYNAGGKLEVVNSSFRGNTAVWGGGVMNLAGSLTLVNCQLTGNRGMMLGGGLYSYEGSAVLHNCRIVGNTASYAETAGGAAIYNLNATLTLLDSTVADNLSPNGMAIASFCWLPPMRTMVEVANSILYNGGNEVWSNDPGLARITYSDVQGGSAGDGNIDVDPQFVAPGARSIEGEWIDGDYRLQAASPAIDAGSNAALPPDVLDLDADGDITEVLPVDLDNEARVEGTSVDMGAYEQLAKKPPLTEFTLTVCFGGSCLTLSPDPSDPDHTFVGKSRFQIDDLNFKAQVDVILTPTSPAGGNWTGGMTPNIIGPGSGIVTEVWITGTGLDLTALPSSPTTVQVAEMGLDFTPVP
jgi:hypothetical protein